MKTDDDKPFDGYQGKEQEYWNRHHRRYGDSILAVGRGNASPSVNEAEYAKAIEQFKGMVRQDLPGVQRTACRVLDLGYGQGHYAGACADLGFGEYLGIDFAAPPPRLYKVGFKFEQGDISDLTDRGIFDLVYCLDVIFHVVDDLKFERALKGVSLHAGRWVYITSLFRPYVARPYVKHRPVEDFACVLGQPVSIEGWRDNRIARFRVGGST